VPRDGALIRAGSPLPLSRKLVVRRDDVISTGESRVTIRLYQSDSWGRGQLVFFEDTTVTLADYGLLQELGSVMYKGHGSFSVHGMLFNAGTEGTTFALLLQPDGVGLVQVMEGSMRITRGTEELRVRKGEQAWIRPGQPLLIEELASRRQRGKGARPRKRRLGVELGAGLGGDGGRLQATVIPAARFYLPGPLAVDLRAALQEELGQGGALDPEPSLSPGLLLDFGPLFLGLSGQAELIKASVPDCDTLLHGPAELKVRGAVQFRMGASLSLGPSLTLHPQVNASRVGQQDITVLSTVEWRP
jgi:hypothetical protein